MYKIILGLCFLLLQTSCAKFDESIYRDANRSIEDRVENLLSQMTLKEKAMQLIAIELDFNILIVKESIL